MRLDGGPVLPAPLLRHLGADVESSHRWLPSVVVPCVVGLNLLPWRSARPSSPPRADGCPIADSLRRAHRLAGRPAAVRGLRCQTARRTRCSVERCHGDLADGAAGDRARAAGRRPRGRGIAVRRPGPQARARSQVRPQAVAGRRGRDGDAASPAAARARRRGRPGPGRSLAMALARLRPGRGDRHRDRRSGPGCRSIGACGEAAGAVRWAAGAASGSPTRPGSGSTGPAPPARAPGRRRLDDRRHARGLRRGPPRGRRATGRRPDARARPVIGVGSPGGREAQTGSDGRDRSVRWRIGAPSAMASGASSRRPPERSRGGVQVPDRPDQRSGDAGDVRDRDRRDRRSGLSDRPGCIRGLRPSGLLRELPGLHDG